MLHHSYKMSFFWLDRNKYDQILKVKQNKKLTIYRENGKKQQQQFLTQGKAYANGKGKAIEHESVNIQI